MSELKKPCKACGRIVKDHKLSEIILCSYEGMPLKNGGTFNKETAKEIVASLKEKLFR